MSSTKRLTTSNFIVRSRNTHQDKYDYTLVNYVNSHTKVQIICPVHGEFEQLPTNHIRGAGCKQCSSIQRKNTNIQKYGYVNPLHNPIQRDKSNQTKMERYGTEFPSQCSDIRQKIKNTNIQRYGVEHNFQIPDVRKQIIETNKKRYGAEYPIQNLDVQLKQQQTNLRLYGVKNPSRNNDIKLKRQKTNLERYGVTCPFQNSDIQHKIATTNLERYGVMYPLQNFNIQLKQQQTNLILYGVKNPIQNNDIKLKQQQTNIDRYGYASPFESPDIQNNIKLTNLNRYGYASPFENPDVQYKVNQTNINRYGTIRFNQQHMIPMFPLLEDQYWLIEQYINHNKPATQLANELGISDVTIGKYLHLHNIEIRNKFIYSSKCITWLSNIAEQENVFIQHAGNIGEYHIPNTRYRADGYCQETNTIYEFHGDYWHGNPNIFEGNEYNTSTKCTMGELYQRTIKKEQTIRELGYNLIVVWESELK